MPNSSNKKKHNISINITIFSKDRACQLDLLLTSMRKMFQEYALYNIIVLYTVSSDTYKQGYSELIKSHKHINFINESNFKHDLLSQMDSYADFTMFFVDDIVWKERFTVQCNEFELLEKDPDILCLSLRLDPYLTYCYAYDIDMDTPDFDQELRWDWRGETGDFGYPMSLDGHIFRTKDIEPLLSKLSYNNPNSLEGALSNHPLRQAKMICLNKAPIFNMPINKVQTQNTNRHGNISAEYLNKMFLAGYRISLKPLIGFNNYACHQELDVTLKRPILNTIRNVFKLFH